MNDTTLHAFGRQLVAWAEPHLRQGGYPFRKAELQPSLLTAAGIEQPPLVLWINRDSFMAAGLLLLPAGEDEACLAAACRCADALGLTHFTLWSRTEISFWQIAGTRASCRRRTAFGHDRGQRAEDFQTALLQILDDWKQQAVQHTLPPPQLSPHYFASLCWSALQELLPLLTATVQQARANHPAARADALRAAVATARDKALLTLLRLMALDAFALLPPTAPPEGLERAGRFALLTLAPPLAEALAPAGDELPLDPAAAVRSHQLLRRFGQLQFSSDRPRIVKTIEILLAAAAPWLDGVPLPPLPSPLPRRPLLLHPAQPLAADDLIEVASTPLRAAFNLQRALAGRPFPHRQAESPLALRPPAPPEFLAGSLSDATVPGRASWPQLHARLRVSWPTRRFRLPPTLPRWGWELLHLLGIAAPGARLILNLPLQAAAPDLGSWLWMLLAHETTLCAVQVTAGDDWIVHAVKAPPRGEVIRIAGHHGERRLPSATFLRHPLASVTLAVHLPPAAYAALDAGPLRFPEPTQPGEPKGLALYARSTLATNLWSWLGGAGAALAERLAAGLPIPEPEILAALCAAWPDPATAPATSAIDELLARWLPAATFPARAVATMAVAEPARPRRAAPTLTKDLAAELAAEVFCDGVPLFPEHYLYAHYRPTLRNYAFTPPLRRGGEFFEQITLCDARGHTFEVAGAETAEALLLVAATGRDGVALPADRQLTGELVQRYRSDLQRLFLALRRRAYRQHPAEIAERLIAQIWRTRNLPAPEFFAGKDFPSPPPSR